MTTRTDIPEHPGDMPNPESSTPEQLRTWAEKVNKRNKALEAEAVQRGLTEIGLKPDTGLGKAIAREYKGDVSAAAIAAYAKDEYGHEKPDEPEATEPANTDTPGTGQEPDNTSEIPDDERLKAIEQAQTTAANVMAQGTQPKPETQADRLAKHDVKLATEDATRDDARASVTDKLAAYQANR